MMELTATDVRIEDVNTLWKLYFEQRSDRIRDKLVLNFIPLVKYVIGRMFSHLPASVSRDELFSSGSLGLIEAVERYEMSRQVKFETFAIPRIRGAILDELRSNDLMPRSSRMKMKEIQRAIEELERLLKRNPTDEEIAERLGIAVEKYHDQLKDISPICFFSLTDTFQGDGGFRIRQCVSFGTEDRGIFSEYQELKGVLLEAIQRLPKEERLLITLYYYEEMTMKEIGVVLKVSESRVSQIHTQALLRLRNAVEKVMA